MAASATPRLLATYKGWADVGYSAEALATFASSWPGFGEQADPAAFRGAVLFFSFAPNGDLVDVQGDEGLDERAVLALSKEAWAHFAADRLAEAHVLQAEAGHRAALGSAWTAAESAEMFRAAAARRHERIMKEGR